MKHLTSALVLIALFGAHSEQANAVKINSAFSDDLIKSLTQDMQTEADQKEEQEKISAAQKEVINQMEKEQGVKADSKAETKKETKKDAKKDTKKDSKKDAKKDTKGKKETKVEAKKETKKEDDEIPMDQAAIKAYSSVIADAAEDSEPQAPVIYKAVATDEENEKKKPAAYSPDPMGSMIQNEIASIKDASIKAAKESSD